jgi:hypothetical protein
MNRAGDKNYTRAVGFSTVSAVEAYGDNDRHTTSAVDFALTLKGTWR